MIVISHRGCLNGPCPIRENSLSLIETTLAFDNRLYVEVDLWQYGNHILLGHDKGIYPVNLEDLFAEKYSRVIWHCKNVSALKTLLSYPQLHCFYHENDTVTVTSRGWIWTYPGKPLTSRSICVKPELHPELAVEGCYGVCTDYPVRWL